MFLFMYTYGPTFDLSNTDQLEGEFVKLKQARGGCIDRSMREVLISAPLWWQTYALPARISWSESW